MGQKQLAIFEETAYGDDPSTPAGHIVHVTKAPLTSSQSLIQDETISSDRLESRPDLGNITAGGAIEMNVAAEDVGTLLKHLMGTVATSGIDPYQHIFTVGDLPVSLLAEKDLGSTIGTGRYGKFNGSRIGSANFKFPQEGYCTASFNLTSANEVLADAPLDALLDDYGHTSFGAATITVLDEGGAALGVAKSVEINVSNNLDESDYFIGDAGVRGALDEGQSTIDGKLEYKFKDVTLLNKAINGTATSLKITLSRGDGLGSAGNESIEFLLSNIVLERASPPIDGPNGLNGNLTFKAFDTGLQITLKNAVATV